MVNAVCKILTIEGRGGWVAGGCVRLPAEGVPDGVQGPRLANGGWEPRGFKEMGEDNEGAGLCVGLKIGRSKLSGQEVGGAGSSFIGRGWGEVAGYFKGDRGWLGVGAGYV